MGNGQTDTTIDAVNAFARGHRARRLPDIRRALRSATDDDRETPGRAVVPSPPDIIREAVRFVSRLPVRFDTPGPLSHLGSKAVTKTVTRTETRAATGAVLSEFLRTHEAAAILRLSARTLDDYRSRGGGPAYFVFGNHVAYARTDLAKWAAARRSWTTAHADAI